MLVRKLPYADSTSRGSITRRIFDRVLGSSSPRDIGFNPYDRAVRQNLAEEMFRAYRNDEPLGTIERSRRLLRIVEDSIPTPTLRSAYFENLQQLLKGKQKRKIPGQILLGLGTGRSGSTSLSRITATVEGSCCTHENPPLIFWKPEPEQLRFHMDRFRLMAEYFPLVADVSHWWLNALDVFFAEFPAGKAIATIRDPKNCAKSFVRIKGRGKGSYNHWAPYGNGIWVSHNWDPTYPTYPLPDDAANKPDSAKLQSVLRYVEEYHSRLVAFSNSAPGKLLLVRLEELNQYVVQRTMFEFIGQTGSCSKVNLNVRSVDDGISPLYRF